MLTNQSIGYIDAPIPKGLNLKEEINRMRREKNAVILAHYYQTGDIQDIADFVGDSLALAQQAAKTTADIIVFCGVHFMGETAKVLCPDKKVLVPDLNAGCSLADSCPAVDFAEFVKQHPGHVVISYVNTTAAVKAVTDVVVTSTNARQIVESFPEDTKIIFGPDRNLGNYINGITGRKMVLWDGACHVHEQFSLEKILELKPRQLMLPWGLLLRLLYAKSSTTFSQSLYNERRTRLCCLVILQKYNSNLAPSRHLLYCYLGTKRERNAYPFQKNCTNCTANLANILLCNSMDGLQPPDEF